MPHSAQRFVAFLRFQPCYWQCHCLQQNTYLTNIMIGSRSVGMLSFADDYSSDSSSGSDSDSSDSSDSDSSSSDSDSSSSSDSEDEAPPKRSKGKGPLPPPPARPAANGAHRRYDFPTRDNTAEYRQAHSTHIVPMHTLAVK